MSVPADLPAWLRADLLDGAAALFDDDDPLTDCDEDTADGMRARARQLRNAAPEEIR